MAKSFYDRVKEAAGALGEKKDDVVVVGTSSVTAVLVPDSYEDEKLRGKVIVSTYNGDTRDFAYYVASSYVKNPDAGDNGVTLIGKKVEKGESLSETIFGQYRNNGPRILISRDSTYDEEVFKKNASLILNAIDKSIENYKQNSNKKMPTAKIKKFDGESSEAESGAVPNTWGVPIESQEPADSKLPKDAMEVGKPNKDTRSPAERGVALVPVKQKEPVKACPKPVERENLPIFNPSQSESGVFGCWEFGEQSLAIVEKSKLTPNFQARRLSNIGKNEARKERYNAKIDAKIRNKNELLSGNSDENVSGKERKSQVLRNRKLENEISTLNNAGIYNRKLRIYAVKKEGENIDYYARFDYKKTPEPEKPEDIENNVNYFKIKKAGFSYISGDYTPVLEVYENGLENGKLSHSRTLSVVGTSVKGNKQLRAFCMAFSAADMAPPTEERAFANAFYSADKEQRLHISDELAKAADEQRNKYFENEKYLKKPEKSKDKEMSEEEKQDQDRKYAEAKKVYNSPEAKSARAIEKAGKRGRGWKRPSFQKTSILKMTRDVLTLGSIAIGIFIAVGSQGHGYGVDAANRRDVQKITENAGRTYISTQLKTSAEEDKNQEENQGEAVPLSDLNSMTNSAEPTLFNYVVENTLDNVVIDTSRPSNMAELFMGENAETYGYDMQTDLQNVKDRGANLAVTNWFGTDYTIDGIKGAYWALGAMAGQEIKEHGVKVDLNNVVYPNSTTDRNSFVKALESLGMTEDEAVGAAKSYTRAFQDAYIASENLVSVEPEEEITYNLADGQLDETLGALLNKDVDIISVNYDNATNSGIVYALADNGELIKTSFSNGEDYYVEVNNTSGVEAAILDAFDKAEEVENKKDAENDGEVANDKEPSDVVKEEEKTSAEDFFKVVEYAPVAKLNLESKKESKLYDYFGETYGNSLKLFYNIESNKGDDGKAYYSAEFASVGAEDLNITHAGTDVYSTTTQTTTQQKIIYCAIQAISNGECSLGPAPGLHTGEGGKVEEYTVTNLLSNEDKVDARLALIGDGRVMMTTPSATSKDDERVR